MKFAFILASILLAFSQTPDMVSFTSKTGRKLIVSNSVISLDGKSIYNSQYDDIVYDSKLNRLIEENNSVLLFLEKSGRPNLSRIVAFDVKSDTALLIADCVYNDLAGRRPFTDIDNDGFLEFGGFDLNEATVSPDSMYYNPSMFYEIRNGKVKLDSTLIKSMDIEEDGVYLQDPHDKDGYCCITILKPHHKH